MAETVECAVIGAGAVGLAVARALAVAGREVFVLESARTIGTGASSRNSEVIHAGLYYPAGSLKARLCVEGREMLYAYLTARGIDHQRAGKLIVAVDEEQVALLRAIESKGRSNGVRDLRWLEGSEARALEPALRCRAALLSPSTGIFDSHGYMLALEGDARNAGAVFAFDSRVIAGRVDNEGIVLRVDSAGDTMDLSCRHVINCAGLGAQEVAGALEGLAPALVPPLHYAKGNYFYLSGRAPFEHLVYPVPGQASLGIHYTRDLAGQGRFGPDVEWVEHIDYSVDPARAGQFRAAIRTYWPDLPEDALRPGYAGIRPKIQGPGEPAVDFVIQDRSVHGVDGLINLFGIESPGLTSSLALARDVAGRLS